MSLCFSFSKIQLYSMSNIWKWNFNMTFLYYQDSISIVIASSQMKYILYMYLPSWPLRFYNVRISFDIGSQLWIPHMGISAEKKKNFCFTLLDLILSKAFPNQLSSWRGGFFLFEVKISFWGGNLFCRRNHPFKWKSLFEVDFSFWGRNLFLR